MKQFLIPVDFSEASAHTLKFVFELNKHFFARLQVIHLFDMPIAVGDESGQTWSTYDEYRKNADDEIWEFINANKGDYHYETEVSSSAGGHYQGIVDYAKKYQSDLIIVGNKGAGKSGRWTFGSVAKYLLTHPVIPVMAIPLAFTKKEIRKILLTTDLSIPIPDKHCRFLKYFAERTEATIEILHATGEDEISLPVEQKINDSLEQYFGKKASILPIGENTTISDAIISYTEANDIDLLVVVPHFHTWLDRLLIGSETSDLVKKVKIPLLALPDENREKKNKS